MLYLHSNICFHVVQREKFTVCLLLLEHYECTVCILNEHHVRFQYKIYLVTILASSINLVLMPAASDSEEELYWIILRIAVEVSGEAYINVLGTAGNIQFISSGHTSKNARPSGRAV